MAWFDLSVEKLPSYSPDEKAPKDFDAFWKKTLAETAATGPADPHFIQLDDPIFDLVDAYDVTFAGYLGQPIRGWYLEPKNYDVHAQGKLPCVVKYVGYGGGRGLAFEHLEWPVAGFACLVMDTRGQGSSWSTGETPDDAPEGSAGPQIPGFMTRGIQAREDYYYRRVFVDAARAVEAAAAHPHVDAGRIAVTGGSQGGGICIAAAGLSGKRVRLCMPDVPFLCNYKRACTIVDSDPYNEISRFCKTHRGASHHVFEVLSYFDGMHFAPRITAHCLFSAGLMDMTCPPSTVYAAYNRVKAQKEIRVYDFNNHEGGGAFQNIARIRFAQEYL